MKHSEFIDALGGTAAVAQRTNQKLNTVSMWKERGVPWRWRATLASMAEELNVEPPAGFLSPMEAA